MKLPVFIKEAKNTFTLGIPLIISQVLQHSMGFVDTVMLGHLSPLDLAAASVGYNLIIIILIFGIGLLIAVQPYIAQGLGAGFSDKYIGKYVAADIHIALITSVAVIFVNRYFSEFFLRFLEVDPAVIPVTVVYINAFSWGIPFYLVYVVLRSLFEGLSKMRLSMYFAIAGLSVNVIGNYILIYGRFGAPRLGSEGAGYCSAISYGVMLLLAVVYLLLKKRTKLLRMIPTLLLWHTKELKDLIRTGFPIAVGLVFEISMFALFSLLMARFGVTILAANQIAINYATIMFMIPMGVSIALTTRVAFETGRGKHLRSSVIGFSGISLGALIMFLSALVLLVFPEAITSLYTSDIEVKYQAGLLLRLAAVFQIFDGIQVTALGALRGLKDTKIPTVVSFAAYWCVGMTLGYYLGFQSGLGAEGLWYGIITGLIVAAFLHCMRYYYVTNRHLKGNNN